ncbi:MAG TPA: pirin-like C-terminal cupin domain-containing protein [Gemmatimonadaceae bacterium]|nr:pirin-like C-terminal cupin domain-containing protein [Gemmatimonadaceae bacterium]
MTTPPSSPGFAGPGHTASLVVDPAEFAANDPFIVLADDRLELAHGAHVGGEHPHAGFEIATFVVEGALIDRDEGVLRAGDLLWTRAGRGIIHNEEVTTEGRTRILQLWRALPESERWSEPWFETTTRDRAPVRREPIVIPSAVAPVIPSAVAPVIPSAVEGSAPVIPSPSTSLRAGSVDGSLAGRPGAEVVVYAGSSGGVDAPSGRHAPMTLLDVRLERGALSIDVDLPASQAGFVYVLEGAARVGDENAELRAGQIGWLDRSSEEGVSSLRLTSSPTEGTRLVLYAAPPIGESLVFHGPFVGGTREDLMRVSRDYMDGSFVRMSEIARRRLSTASTL